VIVDKLEAEHGQCGLSVCSDSPELRYGLNGNECDLDWEIWRDGCLLVSGGTRWDGCSNWHTNECVHFCFALEAKLFGAILGKVYELAERLLPDWCG
jgi:hypothetical protein